MLAPPTLLWSLTFSQHPWLLQDEGFREMNDLVAFYRENAAILRKTFVDLGFSVYGGENAPYIWVGFPGKPSWDVFAEILERCNIVTTPGSGFGPAGEGFVRASAFGHRCGASAPHNVPGSCFLRVIPAGVEALLGRLAEML